MAPRHAIFTTSTNSNSSMTLTPYQFEQQQQVLNDAAESFYASLRVIYHFTAITRSVAALKMESSDKMDDVLSDSMYLDEALEAHVESLGGAGCDAGNTFVNKYRELAAKYVAKRIGMLAKFDTLKEALGK
jgi:hypothetical protein